MGPPDPDFEILQRQMMLLDQKFTKMNMVLFHIITLVFQYLDTLKVVNFVINFHNMQVSIIGGSKMEHQVAEEDQ